MSYTTPLDSDELRQLIHDYGPTEVQEIDLEVDEELYVNRVLKRSDRRGEVVFAVRTPDCDTLVHRKQIYDEGVFRLPTGGIDYGEKVIDALRRELREETGLTLSSAHLLGIQDCDLYHRGRSVRFVSYIFHVHQTSGKLRPDPEEDIVEFRSASREEILAIAESLRRTPPPYNGWGRWRALAHDLVYRHLAEEVNPNRANECD